MRWSFDAMNDSFFMTNIAPQVGSGFNQHIWKSLERRMRQWPPGLADAVVEMMRVMDMAGRAGPLPAGRAERRGVVGVFARGLRETGDYLRDCGLTV